jgi:hypothetical protein
MPLLPTGLDRMALLGRKTALTLPIRLPIRWPTWGGEAMGRLLVLTALCFASSPGGSPRFRLEW